MSEKLSISIRDLIKKARENLVFKGQLHLSNIKNKDSVDFWLEEDKIVVGAHKVRVLSAYACYRAWCKKKNLKPESIASVKAFSTRLRDLNYPYTESRSKVLYHLSKDLSSYEEASKEFELNKSPKKDKKTKKEAQSES